MVIGSLEEKLLHLQIKAIAPEVLIQAAIIRNSASAGLQVEDLPRFAIRQLISGIRQSIVLSSLLQQGWFAIQNESVALLDASLSIGSNQLVRKVAM